MRRMRVCSVSVSLPWVRFARASLPCQMRLAASLILKDNTKDTLKLEAGYRGVADPGKWGERLYLTTAAHTETAVRVLEVTPASVTGSILTAVTTCLSCCMARVPAATPPYETNPTGL